MRYSYNINVKGDVFTHADDTSVATNNKDSTDVSQKLKILFTQCFDDIFIADGNGGSTPESDKETDTKIPDTGSDSSDIIAFAVLSASLITAFAANIRRKKKISHK